MADGFVATVACIAITSLARSSKVPASPRLSVEETVEALDVSPQTVLRDWKLARAWLAVELRNSSRP